MTDAPDLRDRLIEAATLLFAESGFDGVGLREIAQKAKANLAMISYHFGGKEGLYEAVLREGFLRCPSKVAQLERPLPDPKAPDAKALAIAGLRDHLHGAVMDMQLGRDQNPLDRAFMAVVMRELAEGGTRMEALDREFMQPHFKHMSACLDILKPGLTDAERLGLTVAVMGPVLVSAMLPGLFRLRNGGQPFPPDGEAFADFILAHTLRALGV
jgi:AcrR family transcriptional regulator